MHKFFRILICLIGFYSSLLAAQESLLVFAAASLSNVLIEVDKQFEANTGVTIKHSFAASSTLAKQIENGAPADIFISADVLWMDYLSEKNPTIQKTKTSLLGNSLALIAPKGQSFAVQFSPTYSLSDNFTGKLCTGETESVPVGIYAKQALSYLNWWSSFKGRIVGTQDVRGALNFVERGECIGIIYLTDTLISKKIELIGTFPQQSHKPIIYPMAAVTANKNSNLYLQFLSSEQAKKIFQKYGFQTF